jgi:hypothetical protein
MFMSDQTLDLLENLKRQFFNAEPITDGYTYFTTLATAVEQALGAVVTAGRTDLFPPTTP